MSRENEQTLEVYEKYYKEFFAGTKRRNESRGKTKTAAKASEELKIWCEGFKPLVSHAEILEIGSADGEGTKALMSRDFNATASDAVDGFLKTIRKNGLKPIKYNVLTDRLNRQFDGVLAWHVFVHFTKDDLALALKNIYDLLYPGGRLVFDVKSEKDGDKKTCEWFDYEGDHHLGAERFFQYYSEAELRKIVDDAGLKIVALEKYLSGSDILWLRVVAEKPLHVSPEIREYVETKILPRYGATKGHGVSHIKNVIKRSLNFAEKINSGEIKTTKKDFANLPTELSTGKVNLDMCYIIAAFHDLGREKNDKLHHLVSAAMLLQDEFLQNHFSREQLRVMADAVMDHRASNELDPITIYGRIVSSADRDTDVTVIMRRAYAYNRHICPEKTENEAIEIVREKLFIKFGSPDAYGASKMFLRIRLTRLC